MTKRTICVSLLRAPSALGSDGALSVVLAAKCYHCRGTETVLVPVMDSTEPRTEPCPHCSNGVAVYYEHYDGHVFIETLLATIANLTPDEQTYARTEVEELQRESRASFRRAIQTVKICEWSQGTLKVAPPETSEWGSVR